MNWGFLKWLRGGFGGGLEGFRGLSECLSGGLGAWLGLAWLVALVFVFVSDGDSSLAPVSGFLVVWSFLWVSGRERV